MAAATPTPLQAPPVPGFAQDSGAVRQAKVPSMWVRPGKPAVLSLNFKPSESRIPAQYRRTLQSLAQVVRQRPKLQVAVRGYALGEGKEALALSQERANMIVQYLIAVEGISPERLTAIGTAGSKLASKNPKKKKGKQKRKKGPDVDILLEQP
jgi:outer membrane protein OmpA-like peptidoglycan-associated protein